MPREVKWAISLLAMVGLLWVGWRVYPILVTIHVAVCLILISVILLQSGEAADIAGAFGGSGSQTAFGPRGAATFLSRATTWCAIMFMFTSGGLAVHVRTTTSGGGAGHSVLEQFSKPTTTKPAAPAAPAPIIPAPVSPAPAAPTQSAPAPAPAAPAPATPAPQAPSK